MAAKRQRKMLIVDDKAPVKAPVIPIKRETKVTEKSPKGYFHHLTSNVKGPIDVTLGACTAVVSTRNRAGKTAVLDAMRLALIGSHPIGPHAADLLGLTADGALPWAVLVGATAQTEFRFPEGRKSSQLLRSGDFLSVSSTDPLLPLVTTQELMSLGTAKAREELFRRFGVSETIDVPAALDAQQATLWREVLNISIGDVVERLSNAGTLIRSKKRAQSELIGALEDERTRLQQTMAAVGAPSEDLIRGIEEKLDVWKRFKEQKPSGPSQSLDALGARLVAEAEAFRAIPEPVTEDMLEQQLAALPQHQVVAEKLAALNQVKEATAQQEKDIRIFTLLRTLRERLSTGACLVCKGPAPTPHDHAQLMTEVEAVLQNLKAEFEPNERMRVLAHREYEEAAQALSRVIALQRQEHATLKWRKDNARTSVRTLKAAYEARQQEQGGAQETIQPPAESEEALRAQLTELQNLRASAARLATIAGELRQHEVRSHDLKVVESVLADTLDRLMVTIKKRAEDAINAWMVDGFKAQLVLSDGDRVVCRWEVIGTDGRSHPWGAMSGAEWSMLNVALACGWTEGQKYRFLLLDDSDIAGFNAENLKSALTMLSKAVEAGRLTQVVVAWSRPEEIPVSGWTVVSL